MVEEQTISGQLSKADARRLTNAIRGSTIGPTTLYYAGVTAPVIGAGMALVVQAALEKAGMIDYWVTMLSAIFAAVAGIVWYLIFIRWSYRHRHGRSAEMDQRTEVKLTDAYLAVKRGPIETRIDWSAVESVETGRSYTLIQFDGADALMIPDKWFGKDKSARKAFIDRVFQGSKRE